MTGERTKDALDVNLDIRFDATVVIRFFDIEDGGILSVTLTPNLRWSGVFHH